MAQRNCMGYSKSSECSASGLGSARRLLTPPVGPTLVVGCAIGKVSMEAVSKSILVFYIPMLIVLLLVTYVPALSLWLPGLFH
jgi:TRAP-type C4-dicarboxylate transport system permease large subunit